jgi:hypothetical protein
MHNLGLRAQGVQQIAEKLADVARKKILTAHASAAGVALITHNYQDGAQAVELACIYGKSKTVSFIWPKEFFKTMDDARLDQIDEEYKEERSSYQELLDLSRFRAFGDTSNFSELAAERVAYDVRNEDVPFMPETVSFNCGKNPKSGKTDNRSVVLPGELRGFSEVFNKAATTNDVTEPFSAEEGYDFIVKVFPHHKENTTFKDDVKHVPTIDLWLRPELVNAVELVEHLLVMMADSGENPGALLVHLQIEEDEWRRAKATVKRDTLAASWCYMNTYNIGAREGTVEDKSRQNDTNFTKQEQYHTLGERVDGRFVLSEELSLATKKNPAIYRSMFYTGGEIKDTKLFDELIQLEGMDEAAAFLELQKRGEIAKPGENKGWSERSVYYMRCRAGRDEVFAEKLWRILTWPIDIVENCMVALREEYRQSVISNRPGPGRQKLNGRWTEAPLVGKAAIDHIRRVGVGTLKGRQINKDVRLHTGDTWHKLFLNKEHLNALEDAILWRQGTVKLNVGGENIEEKFEQTVASLPREYVLRTYGG